MELSSSTLLMNIQLGTLTSQTWRQMVHGVITWLSVVLQTALKLGSTWSAVCRITMTLWSAQSMMLLVATSLCWVTCMSFTILVLFHMKDAKLSNYSVMFNFQTHVTKFMSFESSNYTLHLPPYLLLSSRNFSLHINLTHHFSHLFAIHQCYCDGINRRLNMINS